MAPPKWSVFDGLEDENDEDKPGSEAPTDSTENAAGEGVGASEENTFAGGENGEAPEAENAAAGDSEKAGDDPKEGDGNKPDKKELLVCAGAMGTCTQAVSPAPVKLHVLTQHTNYINDPDGSQKLVATDKEQDITALNFVSCKFPDPSKPRPCTPQLLWKDFYEAIVLRGGAHPLTEKSTAYCSSGQGTVEIKMTGQQSAVTPEQVAAANTDMWAAGNPLVDARAALVEMEADPEAGDEKGVGVRAIKATGAGTYPVGSWVSFEATELGKPRSKCTAAELQGINWVVYNDKAQEVNRSTDSGPETQMRFARAGQFTIEGYGVAPGGAKAKKGSALANITIAENRLAGIKASVGTRYRFGEPAVFSLSTLFPVGEEPLPRGQSLEKVVWQLVLNSGPGVATLVASFAGSATVSCTGPCAYVVIATLGAKALQSEKMEAITNRVVSVKADKKSCRPNEEVVFKALFELEPALPAEVAGTQWKSEPLVAGLIAGQAEQRLKFAKEGSYKVYAFVNSPAKSVVAGVQVTQPKLKGAMWVEADGYWEKKVVGFEEKAKLKFVFESVQDLQIEVQLGLIEGGDFTHLGAPFSFKVNATNVHMVEVKFAKSSFEGRLKEGAVIAAQLKCVTPGSSITAEGVGMPRITFTKEEKLLGIAFFKDGIRVRSAAYGDALKCRVYGRNLSAGKDGVQVKIYRLESRMGYDNLRADSLVREEAKVLIDDRGYGEFDFMLDGSEAKGYDKPLHYFYALIEENEYFGDQKLEVWKDEKGAMLVLSVPAKEGEGQTSKVGIEKGEENKDADDGCPNCNKNITLEQIKQVFPDCKDEDRLIESVQAYNEFMKNFSMNTCWNKAHFFAQTRVEAGTSLNIKNEGFNYSVKRLQKGDFSEGKNWVKGNLKAESGGYYTDGKYHNRPFAYFDNHQSEANLYGRKDLNYYNDKAIQTANQEKIANLVYGPNAVMGRQLGNTQEGDGWQYKGRGFIQITGKNNYTQSNIYTKLYAGTEILSREGATKVAEPRVAMIACMAYWKSRGLDKLANGIKQEDKISKKIGTNVDWEGKQKAFTETTSVLFAVDKCRIGKKDDTPADKSDGVLAIMKKLADKHYVYSQLGDRTSNTEEGISKMDCSEFVSRYLYELEITKSVVDIYTGLMTTEANFRSAIGSENIDFVLDSNNLEFVPQRGDIFVWRTNVVGHTGIVYNIDTANDTVIILESIGQVGAVGESKQVANGGDSQVGCTRTAIYDRNGGALANHKGWKGYFRPKNYTKKL